MVLYNAGAMTKGFDMPKNYDKMIVDATHRIANYYQVKLVQSAGQYSADMCEQMYTDAKEMHDGAKDADWYLKFGWMKLGMKMYDLDMDTYQKVVRPFFNVAQKYIEHKQGKYGVYESDEQNVDAAIKKLYARIGEEKQPLEVNPKQKPIDYPQTVADTVEKIAKFYEAKLEKFQSKLSEKKYQEMQAGIENLRAGADVNDADYFVNFGWTKSNVLWNLDREFWEIIGKFFNAVKGYVSAKQQDFIVSKEEKEIMRLVKIINLKVGGGMFVGLKNLILPESRFVTRCDLGVCVESYVKKKHSR